MRVRLVLALVVGLTVAGCGDGGGDRNLAWAVALGEQGQTSAVLRSSDGGASWRYVPTPFEDDVRLVDLSRNTTVR